MKKIWGVHNWTSGSRLGPRPRGGPRQVEPFQLQGTAYLAVGTGRRRIGDILAVLPGATRADILSIGLAELLQRDLDKVAVGLAQLDVFAFDSDQLGLDGELAVGTGPRPRRRLGRIGQQRHRQDKHEWNSHSRTPCSTGYADPTFHAARRQAHELVPPGRRPIVQCRFYTPKECLSILPGHDVRQSMQDL